MQTNQTITPPVQQPTTRTNEPEPISSFTFDLDDMKKAVNSPKVKVPHSAIVNEDSFDNWLNE